MTNPAGTGRRRSTTSRTITGRCENSASTLLPLALNRSRPPSGPTPPSWTDRPLPLCPPGSARLKAGGVGANNRAGREAGVEPATGPICQCLLLLAVFLFPLHTEVGNVGGREDRGVALAVEFPEPLCIPDFDAVVHPGDDHLTRQARELPQMLGDRDPPLFVGGDLDGTGEQGACCLAFGRPALGGFARVVGDALELRGRVDGEAAIERLGHHCPALELVAKPRRQDDPALRVERVLVFAQEHRLRTT